LTTLNEGQHFEIEESRGKTSAVNLRFKMIRRPSLRNVRVVAA
jgi:hypothetical protein